MTGSDDFVAIIRAAVEADPGNVGLRVDLIELLLQERLDGAAAEIDALAMLGANQATVLVLRARLAAARLRAGQVPDAEPQAKVPSVAAPPVPAPAPASAPAPEPAASVSPSTDPGDPLLVPVQSEPDEKPVWDVERPSVTLADVAGLEEVKAHLNGSFLLPMRNPEMTRMFGKAPRGSLLMYGPPGCGKTFIARAIAGELDANFVHATLADIVRPHFGETEQAIHSLFEAARAARPCVVFIDEFEAGVHP